MFYRGIMISQTWPTSNKKNGATLAALRECLALDYFDAIQTVEIPYRDERKEFSKLIRENNLQYTYCIARILNADKLSLSSLNQLHRKEAIKRSIECCSEASEAGAQTITVIPGKAPINKEDRRKALSCLLQSLRELIVVAKNYGLKVSIEPLDIDRHKKQTLGFTEEALYLCEVLAEEGLCLSLTLDTAHMLLNEEDITHSFVSAKSHLSEFHICNCITDPNDTLFGDLHLPVGIPNSKIDKDEIKKLLRSLYDKNFFDNLNTTFFYEVLNTDDDAHTTLLEVKNLMDFVFAYLEELHV